MNFHDSRGEAAFRAAARSWLQGNAPKFRPQPEDREREQIQLGRKWMACKAKAGFVGIHLPKSIGGRGGSPSELLIFQEEESRFQLPQSNFFTLGVGVVLPVLLAHGTPEQIERVALRTLCGETVWCQLFSEPAAGSDLAGIRTRAVREGGRWIINGQKVWNACAHLLEYGLLVTRSDSTVPKHQGLTCFILDLKKKGVEARPMKQISGRSDFNEVFFTDVIVEDTDRVGPIGGGWQVAMTTMFNERLAMSGDPEINHNYFPVLMELACRRVGADRRRLIDNDLVRSQLADYFVAYNGGELIRYRQQTALSRGDELGPEAAASKLILCKWMQDMGTLGMDLMGPAGAVRGRKGEALSEAQFAFLHGAGHRIGGGTEEIALNLIAERILGLPSEYRPDKAVPFDQVPTARGGNLTR